MLSSTLQPPSQPPRPHQSSRHHAAASTSSAPALGKPRRHSLPFSFPPLFQSNTSSTSLVPSTAEGKPIPVDDSTAEHRTSALRELNSNFPSRHRYAKSTGAQSSTYSQPVIVRSYYAPVPTRPVSTDRGVVIVNGRGHRTTLSESGGPAALVRRVLPFTSNITPARNGMLGTMARNRTKKRLNEPEEAKLPPVEAFRFKSFMANIDDQSGGTDINADLDRIAEICAKSRYSLSNQYEVHYAPHGSGSSFIPGVAQTQEPQGPTLQAVSSDDERNLRRSRRRPMGIRRNSRAMGTLETIMSSSRSSDEDKSKKKSAAEIAEEVRGRAAKKGSRHESSASSSENGAEENAPQEEDAMTQSATRRRRSGSLALIDGTRLSMHLNELNSATGLVGEPALPQTSSSQLEIRTAPEAAHKERIPAPPKTRPVIVEGLDQPLARGSISPVDASHARHSFISTLSGWMTWRAPESTPHSHGRAEGSLRELLKSTDVKGKGIETVAYH
ncbi:hypothetical protein NCS57_01138400 [Fusarium keratoplasticum]|uniref:Uncharacterized protein n=1 Tax=Fusarium keratoplasticum TaxID=1328300 RepID=A0ACC0QNC4_9HYPO|nr:hypothetical protein NCS57_01138400 [Fusarium keratoplasticum]KAI8657599.1 hypothetical protein NCS57_01138400 [Fusarium keratoplasticum]KAI8658563.1 hypothetical protein NCS55_01133000 [Fusarium keratoplasticum]